MNLQFFLDESKAESAAFRQQPHPLEAAWERGNEVSGTKSDVFGTICMDPETITFHQRLVLNLLKWFYFVVQDRSVICPDFEGLLGFGGLLGEFLHVFRGPVNRFASFQGRANRRLIPKTET